MRGEFTILLMGMLQQMRTKRIHLTYRKGCVMSNKTVLDKYGNRRTLDECNAIMLLDIARTFGRDGQCEKAVKLHREAMMILKHRGNIKMGENQKYLSEKLLVAQILSIVIQRKSLYRIHSMTAQCLPLSNWSMTRFG